MSRTQQLVDEVRAVAASGDHTLTDRLRELAADFAAVSEEAEARLRRCEDLLRRGLRAEAIHQADLEPPLLDVLGRLTFAGREQWDEITALYGLPAAPGVSADRATELNRAYGEQQPLAPLLRQLRLLARSRAPDAARLVVLREMARLDPHNPAWPEDVAGLEAYRLRELGAEADRAVKADDRAALDALFAEMTAAGWQETPPTGLVSRVARAAMPRAILRLSEAVRTNDLPGARRLRAELSARLKASGLTGADPLAAQAHQALQAADAVESRLAEEEQFNQAVLDLKVALDNPAATEEQIDALYNRARLSNRRLPKEVEKVYARRAKVFDRAREFRYAVYSILIVVLGAAALVGFILLVNSAH